MTVIALVSSIDPVFRSKKVHPHQRSESKRHEKACQGVGVK
jgi:hypothetical protein